MKYICPLIVVKDIAVSRKFYEQVLGQKVKFDFGENVSFEGDFFFFFLEHYLGLLKNDSIKIKNRSNNFELYFEEDEIEKAVEGIAQSGVEFIHHMYEQPWGQRCARFYDPDGHIIEIGESMESVVVRFYNQGIDVADIPNKTSLPIEFVESALKQRIPGYKG